MALDNMATRKKKFDEHLRLASRDDSVTGNELCEDTTGSLDTEGKCGDVDEDDILSAFLPREDTTLNSSTIRNSLIWVDALGRLFATKELLEKLLNLGYTGGTANEYDLVRKLTPRPSVQ
jgi:NAD-specific glutamate dehydrogenase